MSLKIICIKLTNTEALSIGRRRVHICCCSHFPFFYQ